MKWQKLYNIQLILLKREQTLFLTNKSDFSWLFIEFYTYTYAIIYKPKEIIFFHKRINAKFI
jgi:hypothetical protein